MNGQIIGLAPGLAPSLNPWLATSAHGAMGLAVRDWAVQRYELAVQDVFGYHALQLGAFQLPTLANSRIAHRWVATDSLQDTPAALFANASALPFFEATLDLVTLPFTLDAHSDPDSVLDEVARVLVPEGCAIFAGFHASSLWGLSHALGSHWLPEGIHIYGLGRLKASLAELGLAVQSVQTGQWLMQGGKRLWSSYNGLYFVVAKKRVLAVRPTRRAAWRLPKWAHVLPSAVPSPRRQPLYKDVISPHVAPQN